MAKKDISLNYDAQWLDSSKLKLANGDASDALALVTGGDIDIDFEIVIPKDLVGDDAIKIDLEKIPDVMRLKASVKSKTEEVLDVVLGHWKSDQAGDDQAYADAKKALDALNSFIERCIEKLRPSMRAMIAKTIGGKAKADDLQTFGRASFEKFEIRVGSFENEMEIESPLLDLSKALKRKKWQNFGVAWKADDCVIAVNPKKEFKKAMLKELRDALPEGARQGAKMCGGRFKADSATNVTFQFPEKGDKPRDILLRDAMKTQSGSAVHVVCTTEPLESEEGGKTQEKSEKNESGATAKSSATASPKPGTKPPATKSSPPKGVPPKGAPTKGAPTKGSPTKGAPPKGGSPQGNATKGGPTKGGPPKGSPPKK